MKKAIVLIILFAILAITFTATMINIKKIEMLENMNNYTPSNSTSSATSSPTIVSSSKIKKNEKFGKYGNYDENDCWMESKTIKANGYDIEIPQVNGLKDKAIQDKINNNIEVVVKEDISKVINDIGGTIVEVSYHDPEYTIQRWDYDETKKYPLGFSNLISIISEIMYKKDEQDLIHNSYLNYELVNGNRLSIYDIFDDDADIKPVLASMLHGQNAGSEYWRMWDQFYDHEEYYGATRFDSENNVWVYDHYVKKDVNAEGDYVVDEELDYVPKYTDYEITKIVNKFLKYNSYNFNLNRNILLVEFDEDCGGGEYYKDISNDLVIYDKYTTQESLFERDDIGKKDLLRYANSDYYPVFESDNLIYQVSYLDFDNIDVKANELIPNEFLRKLIDSYNKEIDDTLNEYREKAKEKKQAYYLYFAPYLKMVENDDRVWNVVECMPNLEVFSCDYKDKDVLYDTIFGNLVYYNTRMYGELNEGRNFARYVKELSSSSKYRFEDETYQEYNFGKLEYVTEKGIGIKYDILEKTNSTFINVESKETYEATSNDYNEYGGIDYENILSKLDAQRWSVVDGY